MELEWRVSEKPLVASKPSWRWLLLLVYVALLAGVALMWRDPEMRHWLEPQEIRRTGLALLETPLGPLAVLGAYVLAVMMGMPSGLLASAGVLIFGAWPGVLYALLGMTSGAVVTYGIGRYTGGDAVARWSSGRLGLLSQLMRERGLLAVFMLRAVPVAPYIMVNLFCGAMRVRLRDYVVGTMLGISPMILMLAFFVDRLTAALQSPGPGTYAALVACVVALVLISVWMRKRLSKVA